MDHGVIREELQPYTGSVLVGNNPLARYISEGLFMFGDKKQKHTCELDILSYKEFGMVYGNEKKLTVFKRANNEDFKNPRAWMQGASQLFRHAVNVIQTKPFHTGYSVGQISTYEDIIEEAKTKIVVVPLVLIKHMHQVTVIFFNDRDDFLNIVLCDPQGRIWEGGGKRDHVEIPLHIWDYSYQYELMADFFLRFSREYEKDPKIYQKTFLPINTCMKAHVIPASAFIPVPICFTHTIFTHFVIHKTCCSIQCGAHPEDVMQTLFNTPLDVSNLYLEFATTVSAKLKAVHDDSVRKRTPRPPSSPARVPGRGPRKSNQRKRRTKSRKTRKRKRSRP